MNHDEKHKLLAEAVAGMREAHEHANAMEDAVDAALRACDDPECVTCGQIVCPYGDTFHYHHDGCPSCSREYEDYTSPRTLQ